MFHRRTTICFDVRNLSVENAQKYSEMGADAFVTDNIRDVRQYCRTH